MLIGDSLACIETSLLWSAEVSEYLVDSAAFKAVGTSDPRPAGSIPVHLRFAEWRGIGRSEATDPVHLREAR